MGQGTGSPFPPHNEKKQFQSMMKSRNDEIHSHEIQSQFLVVFDYHNWLFIIDCCNCDILDVIIDYSILTCHNYLTWITSQFKLFSISTSQLWEKSNEISHLWQTDSQLLVIIDSSISTVIKSVISRLFISIDLQLWLVTFTLLTCHNFNFSKFQLMAI